MRCKECLEESKHVFVEKPLATEYRHSQELVKLAREKGVILMVGHIFRYNEAVKFVRDQVQQGLAGRVYYMFGRFMDFKRPREDVGAVLNFAIHHIDMFNFILNDVPREVLCITRHILGRSEYEDLGIIALRYGDGALGLVEVGWLCPNKYRELVVIGEKKSFFTELIEQEVRVCEARMEKWEGYFEPVWGEVLIKSIKHEEPLKLELTDFIQSIRSGGVPSVDPASVLAVMKTLDATLESAKSERWVKIEYEPPYGD